MLPVISNAQARRVLLERQGLCDDPRRTIDKTSLLALIERMGFIQLDSISTVERAHHMIAFSRNQTYRRQHLHTLLERDRSLFENWTHDASIIPTTFYPFWQHRFERERVRLQSRWEKWRRPGFQHAAEDILSRIREHGELMSRDSANDAQHCGETTSKKGDGWWDWHPSKTALEFLWRTGKLAVSRRTGFQKVYDLTERVIPCAHIRAMPPPDQETVDWACSSALDRLGIATSGELSAFWDAVSPAQAKAWAEHALGREVVQVSVESADGTRARTALARPALLDNLDRLPPAPPRLRLLSPFDPVLRDRARARRLFGFDYRIEVFVPAAKRRYGYYVFPMLEGDRMVGRVDLKLHREQARLDVLGLWWEPGVRTGRGRLQRLDAELARLCRFVGATDIRWAP